MNQYRYTVDDDSATFEGAYPFNSDCDENSAEFIAEASAEHYYLESEGVWEWSGSMSIQIFKEDGTKLGVFDVWYENSPYFTACRKINS
ncbi:MAG: hypothetical protein ON057_000467 [Glomeribacter sp. 1016415]|nr:hypothetical protein [Glomeribacter sp. 1016415]